MPTEHDCIEKEKSEMDDFCWLGVFTIVTKEKKKPKTSEGWVHSALGEGRKPQEKFSKMVGLALSFFFNKTKHSRNLEMFPSKSPTIPFFNIKGMKGVDIKAPVQNNNHFILSPWVGHYAIFK